MLLDAFWDRKKGKSIFAKGMGQTRSCRHRLLRPLTRLYGAVYALLGKNWVTDLSRETPSTEIGKDGAPSGGARVQEPHLPERDLTGQTLPDSMRWRAGALKTTQDHSAQ